MTQYSLNTIISFDISVIYFIFYFFFFTDPATTEIYTLSLHDALPISLIGMSTAPLHRQSLNPGCQYGVNGDRKSTRLNSSHVSISYAVFCLKKKKKKKNSH